MSEISMLTVNVHDIGGVIISACFSVTAPEHLAVIKSNVNSSVSILVKCESVQQLKLG